MPRGDGRRIRPVNRPTVNRVTTEELQRSNLRENQPAGSTHFMNGYGYACSSRSACAHGHAQW